MRRRRMLSDDRGRSVRRLEDARFLTGRGRYVEDFALPGEVHAYVLRSPHAHAVIEGIDTAGAQEAAGVLGVFTEADLAADGIGHLPLRCAGEHCRAYDRAAALRAGARTRASCRR